MTDLFHELNKSTPTTVDDPSTRPSIVRLRLGVPGQALRGGVWTLEKWRQLLGMNRLEADDRRLSLVRAEVNLADGHIELAMEGETIGNPVIHLLPCQREGEAQLGVWVALQGAVESRAIERLLVYTQAQLQPATYQTLLRVFRLDPEVHLVTASRAQGSDPDGVEEIFERSVVRSHSSPEAWHVFFAELEQQRNFNSYLSGNILVIKHEDLECCFATPPLRPDLISFINYSLSHLSQSPDESPEEGQRPSTRHWGEITTDLQETDVIGGGLGRVERLLDKVATLAERPELIIVRTSCVPKVTGDDLQGVVRRFEDRSGIVTVFLDAIADEEADSFSTLLERLRWEPEFYHPQAVAGRLNLVGYPAGSEMERLVRMLEQLGVAVNARLVPEIRMADIRRYTWAELQVFLDCKLYRSTYRQILGNVDIPSLYPTPPYGLRGTRSWVAEVAGAMGVDQALGAIWDVEWAPLADEWAELTGRARDHVLGFVLDRRGAELLLDPTQSTGVAMLSMLKEMEFGLEFLVLQGSGSDQELPGRCHTYGSAEELEELLRRSEAAAFYSEFYFDRRLSRCGKAQFSVSDFQLGLGGAIETLRQLLRICELPFYRRYGQLLNGAFQAEANRHDLAGTV